MRGWNDLSTLTPHERFRFDLSAYAWLVAVEPAFADYDSGHFPDDSMVIFRNNVPGVVEGRGGSNGGGNGRCGSAPGSETTSNTSSQRRIKRARAPASTRSKRRHSASSPRGPSEGGTSSRSRWLGGGGCRERTGAGVTPNARSPTWFHSETTAARVANVFSGRNFVQ